MTGREGGVTLGVGLWNSKPAYKPPKTLATKICSKEGYYDLQQTQQ